MVLLRQSIVSILVESIEIKEKIQANKWSWDRRIHLLMSEKIKSLPILKDPLKPLPTLWSRSLNLDTVIWDRTLIRNKIRKTVARELKVAAILWAPKRLQWLKAQPGLKVVNINIEVALCTKDNKMTTPKPVYTVEAARKTSLCSRLAPLQRECQEYQPHSIKEYCHGNTDK